MIAAVQRGSRSVIEISHAIVIVILEVNIVIHNKVRESFRAVSVNLLYVVLGVVTSVVVHF